MYRLTQRDENGNVFIKDSNGYLKCNYSKENDKLAAYEDAEEQGLLHKASIPNGTPIFTLSSNEEVEFFGDEPLNEASYLYGYTEFVYGQMGERWFLSKEAANDALKEGR